VTNTNANTARLLISMGAGWYLRLRPVTGKVLKNPWQEYVFAMIVRAKQALT